MHQYLLGHDYWSYVDGANDAAPEPTHKDFPAWEQSTSRVLYCFASCVGEQLLSYVRDAQTPKGAWENLQEGFRREYHNSEASAPTGVEQLTTTRLVGGGLYLEDQGYPRLPRLHRGEHRGERDGPDLPRRFGAEVRRVLNGCVHPGEDTVIF